MAGTIIKRKNSFRLQYMYNGERFSKTIHSKDKKMAQLELAKFIEEIEKGQYTNNSFSFEEFTLVWLRDVVKPSCTIKTLMTYKSYCKNRILPYLGKYRLTDITPMILNSFFNDQKQSDTLYATRQNVPLSKSSMQKIYKIVSAILRTAFEFDLIPNNPISKVRIKFDNMESEVLKETKIKYYDEKTYRKVIECLKTEPLEFRSLIELALKTGLRKSELYGLTWNNIDFKNKTITVDKTRQFINKIGVKITPTKTKSSIRTISVSTTVLELLDKLERGSEFVFNFNMETVSGDLFRKFQDKYKIKRIRFHDLRHTHAVLLLLKGVDIKTISKRLGHANTSTTSNVYLHFLKELDIKASELLD